MGILNRALEYFSGRQKSQGRERRELKRIACNHAFLCTKGKQSFPITVVDVGFGGFKVTSERELGERGDILHLRKIAQDFRRHLTGAYTTGLMVRIAWTKAVDGGFEAGLYLPEAPGSMRIAWFRQLLGEMGMDEKTIFTQRKSRRHRCRITGQLDCSPVPASKGSIRDLSMGGALLLCRKAPPMGSTGHLLVEWNGHLIRPAVEVVGVAPAGLNDPEHKWKISLKFRGALDRDEERALSDWLEELGRHD